MDPLLWPLLRYGATFALALLLGLYLTPLVRRTALRLGVLDRPDAALKRHARPTPYLGGIAVYLSFLITMAVVFDFERATLGLLLGATMLTMLGLFDDLKAAGPYLKLLLQLLAAWVVLKSGIGIHLVAVPLAIALPLSVVWLIGMTNAANILDVSDGLLGGTSAIASLAFFVVGLQGGDALLASTSLALAGALLGFLPSNLPRARIYLGDAGSLFVGFLLASFAMLGSYTRTSLVGAVAPLVILLVPLLETGLVIVARLASGRSPLRGSPDHLALRLQARGWSASRVNRLAYGLALYGALSGVALTRAPHAVALVLVGGAALLYVLVGGWLLSRCPAPRALDTRASAAAGADAAPAPRTP